MNHTDSVMARFDEDLRNEKIGCMFGWEAAKAGKVLYVEYEPRELWKAFVQFMQNTRFRILAVLPTGTDNSPIPQTFDQGKDLALEMYEEIILTCRSMSIDMHNRFFDESWYPQQAALNTVPIIGQTIEGMQTIMADNRARETICNSIPKPGSLFALQVIQETGDIEQVVPFVMAPYYTSVHEGQQHTRYARDYGLFLTLQSDIHAAMTTRQADVAKTQKWKKEATGHAYTTQGLHIPVAVTK